LGHAFLGEGEVFSGMKDGLTPIGDVYLVTILFEIAPIDGKHLVYHSLAICADLLAHFVMAPLDVDDRETLTVAQGKFG
jgi:hypothetical protein